jgi:hypothetical protein
MVKQVVTSVLWFFTIAWGWNIVAFVTGLPAIIGLALGVAAAAFVWIDPLQLIRVTRAEAQHTAQAPAHLATSIRHPA